MIYISCQFIIPWLACLQKIWVWKSEQYDFVLLPLKLISWFHGDKDPIFGFDLVQKNGKFHFIICLLFIQSPFQNKTVRKLGDAFPFHSRASPLPALAPSWSWSNFRLTARLPVLIPKCWVPSIHVCSRKDHYVFTLDLRMRELLALILGPKYSEGGAEGRLFTKTF